MLKCQLLGISTVGFDPLARLTGYQRRRRHRAAVAESNQLPVNAMAASAGLVDKLQTTAVLGQPTSQIGDITWRVRNRTDEAHRTIRGLPRPL